MVAWPVLDQAKASPKPESGAMSKSPMCMKGVQILGATFAAFRDTLARSWIGNGVAGSQTAVAIRVIDIACGSLAYCNTTLVPYKDFLNQYKKIFEYLYGSAK